MKKTLLVLAALPCFCFSFQQTKEPYLRIETLHPDGTKTVREMVQPQVSKIQQPEKPPQTTQLPPQQFSRNHPQILPSDSSLLTEKQRYLAMIIAKIQQNWFVDDTMRGKECRINIKLSPDGVVTGTSVLGGDYNLCMSAIDAVKKAGNFPMSKDPAVYDALKDLTTILRPELR